MAASLIDLLQTVIILVMLPSRGSQQLLLPGLSQECYAKPGDVLVGLVTRATRSRPGSSNECSNLTSSLLQMQQIEIFVYEIERINSDASLLPNITLGFVILDSCSIYPSYLGQAARFFPSESMVAPPDVVPCDGRSLTSQFDVVAVAGEGRSWTAVPVALAMSTSHIPMVGTTETSDELTDKTRFSYFVPLSLPDKFQTNAILQLLAKWNFTYFIVIYAEGSYGENGAKLLAKWAPSYGLCIEESYIIYLDSYWSDLQNIYQQLEYRSTARAVAMFMEDNVGGFFYNNLPRNLHNRFVYIGADGVGYATYGQPANGLITVNLQNQWHRDSEKYFRSLTPNNNANPWFIHLWRELHNCTVSDPESQQSCDQSMDSTLPGTLTFYPHTSIWQDSVRVITHGLHDLVTSQCPEVFDNPSELRMCVKNTDLLQFITTVSFDGVSGRIEFNEDGMIRSGYVIKQYHAVSDDTSTIGHWHNPGGLELIHEAIDWSYFTGARSDGIPESVCSHPCLPKQYFIQKEVTCCWECRYCRDNEIIVNGTECAVCAENTWPDDLTATLCEQIQPVFLQYTDNIGIGLTILSTTGMMGTLLTSFLLGLYWDRRLIKASSRELMIVILTGILLAFAGSLIILAKPHPTVCFLRDFSFSVSVTVIYAPLLMKTVRVYRIFSAGGQGKQSLKLTSSRALMLMSMTTVSIQVILTVAVTIWRPSQPLTRMPILTERYAEQFCSLPPEVLSVLLVVNLTLLMICAAFGFLTRKLPDNFNESWFIFISVATTTFLWVVFLPTYFTTFYAYYKTALLSTCLILNAFITLLCLFIPKLYAAKFVDEEKMKFAATSMATAPSMASVA